ncbi:MAG: hypothetical protein Q8P56_00500 [Candidatus Uhrbacteria bacterium]|nr:hypothetical protein [Candidatus Uhrbacteria bacterium]
MYHEKKDIPYLVCLALCAFVIMISFSANVSHLFFIRMLGVGYFFCAGFLPARRFFGLPPLHAAFLAPLISIMPFTIIGSVLYALGSLSPSVIIFLLWIPALVAVATSFIPPLNRTESPNTKENLVLSDLLFPILYGILICGFLAFLFIHRTTDSLLGPWDSLSALPIALYALASLVLCVQAIRGKSVSLSLSMLVIHFFSSFSVALIRFPLSFGFDPLLHMAAERIVVATGVIEPKTFYYVGQYVLVPFFSRLFSLPVEWIHQPLLPFILSLSIPPLAFVALRNLFRLKDSQCLFLTATLLVLPYSYFSMTTPWGLAYGIILAGVLSSAIACSEGKIRFILLAGTCALFSLVLHPLAGIPLSIFVALLFVGDIKRRALRMGLLIAGAIFASLSIPLAFAVNSLLSSQLRISFTIPALSSLFDPSLLIPIFETRFSPFLDFAYFFFRNGWIAFLALAVYGAILLFKKRFENPRPSHFFIVCLIMAIALHIEALVLSGFIHFESLASFEQQDYPRRLVDIANLFLLPFAGYAFGVLFQRVRTHGKKIILITFLLFFSCLLTASLYLSYPRNDAYTPFHGHTLSATDIAAVRFIDTDGSTTPYVVIANQVLASAAIREFGFKTYYPITRNEKEEQLFYYPVPSGSPLAQQYYSMLTSPSRQTMIQAMSTVGVARSYFVVRDYEPRFPIIVRDAKKTANAWREIDGGKAYVFTYFR